MIPRLLQAFWRFRFILENPVELVLVFNTTQKVYYTETKSTFKTFGTENNATFAVEKENKSYTVDIEQKSKINQLLLSATPKGLLFSEWLKRNGYSDQLIKRYRESGWLEMLSKGVMYRTGDSLSAYAALSCYNRQLGKNVPCCGAFRTGTVRLQSLCAYGETVADGGTWQTACSGMDTPRCFRQGDKTVFHRYLFRTAGHNDCERRSGPAGFHARTGIPGMPVCSHRNNIPIWTCST